MAATASSAPSSASRAPIQAAVTKALVAIIEGSELEANPAILEDVESVVFSNEIEAFVAYAQPNVPCDSCANNVT
jgi:hypothetical protein